LTNLCGTAVVDNSDMIARWVISFGTSVQVEHPQALKDKIAEMVEELHEHYISSGVAHR